MIWLMILFLVNSQITILGVAKNTLGGQVSRVFGEDAFDGQNVGDGRFVGGIAGHIDDSAKLSRRRLSWSAGSEGSRGKSSDSGRHDRLRRVGS